ncbi:hypothetical protein RHA1_ro03832 [Rhodococcus jostii RHA1]|uniref:Uncharacterized protein n=1 Tax=Rhodococcus jostii (strain RHA1) TaxID=101510 RepID=Q0SA04_RHOJR|nr:hypothetical protein RHA1_ro03832 [Rhodococcus jostii RHA1]
MTLPDLVVVGPNGPVLASRCGEDSVRRGGGPRRCGDGRGGPGAPGNDWTWQSREGDAWTFGGLRWRGRRITGSSWVQWKLATSTVPSGTGCRPRTNRSRSSTTAEAQHPTRREERARGRVTLGNSGATWHDLVCDEQYR